MKASLYHFKTLRDTPSDAELISHKLMIKANMIKPIASGIYTWLPLGTLILRKVENIIRKELNHGNCLEIIMPLVQPKDLWDQSGRSKEYGPELLGFKDRNQRDFYLGPTHEEIITDIAKKEITSPKDLPKTFYQIKDKFRDEIRPRFGVMRAREFLMKDAYSFDFDYKNSIRSYNIMFIAYMQLFKKMGLKAIPMKADTGPIGGDLSHEFIILADTGESEVYVDKQLLNIEGSLLNINYNDNLQEEVNKFTSLYAATEEKHDASNFDNKNNTLIKTRGIEVGHIFHFGQKYSLPMRATITDKAGENIPVFMGSYGVGLSRLVGAVIEANHDQKGIIWPKEVTPWDYNIINLKCGDIDCDKICSELYYAMNNNENAINNNKNSINVWLYF